MERPTDREEIAGRIERLATPLAVRAGLEIFAVHYRPEQGRMVVRLVVDHPSGGVTLDTLADLSRQVGHQLEAEDVVPGKYHLECTSPGVERPLLRPVHFQRAVGHRVRMRVTEPGAPTRRIRGTLSDVDEYGVTIEDDAIGRQHVAYGSITEAKTEFDAARALAGRERR